MQAKGANLHESELFVRWVGMSLAMLNRDVGYEYIYFAFCVATSGAGLWLFDLPGLVVGAAVGMEQPWA